MKLAIPAFLLDNKQLIQEQNFKIGKQLGKHLPVLFLQSDNGDVCDIWLNEGDFFYIAFTIRLERAYKSFYFKEREGFLKLQGHAISKVYFKRIQKMWLNAVIHIIRDYKLLSFEPIYASHGEPLYA